MCIVIGNNGYAVSNILFTLEESFIVKIIPYFI